jgi:ribosomal protein L7Ae-like RNA K-turn-binding protein
MSDNTLNLLGMAKKAGMLEIGSDSVVACARGGKARLIISASDASENSLRSAENCAAAAGAALITVPYTKDDIGAVVGRGSPGMLAITDIGMACAFAEKLSRSYPDKYDQACAVLKEKAQRASSRKSSTKERNSNIGKGKRRMNK